MLRRHGWAVMRMTGGVTCACGAEVSDEAVGYGIRARGSRSECRMETWSADDRRERGQRAVRGVVRDGRRQPDRGLQEPETGVAAAVLRGAGHVLPRPRGGRRRDDEPGIPRHDL